MNKKMKLIPLGILATFALSLIPSVSMKGASADVKTYHVDFFDNYLREEFTLSSGYKGRGNNLLYKTVDVSENSKVEKPADPKRTNYDFAGWYKETECTNVWDFSKDVVKANTRLFAKWEYSKEAEVLEPTYVPPSTVLEESAEDPYVLSSIMSFKVTWLDDTTGNINLSNSAIARLKKRPTNILPLMEYKVKASKNLTATYTEADPKDYITLTCDGDSKTIYVNPKDYEVTSNPDYENKAKNYEKKIDKEDENYHVMLAGSSSIEFWETSTEDMDPIVTYNHGIGGTTVEDWDTCLNQRLVYPYKPKMVVYYVGINNLVNAGKSASDTLKVLKKFFDNTHAALPDTKVQYILLNLVPGFPQQYDNIRDVNAGVIDYQKSHSEWLTLINPGEALLKENGEPNAAYFRTDGLHLTYFGYTIWGGIIRESIIEGLKNE